MEVLKNGRKIYTHDELPDAVQPVVGIGPGYGKVKIC